MNITIDKPFKMDGSHWSGEYDSAPSGFRVGNTYNLPQDAAELVIRAGWGHEPGKKSVDVVAGSADLQPDSGTIGHTASGSNE